MLQNVIEAGALLKFSKLFDDYIDMFINDFENEEYDYLLWEDERKDENWCHDDVNESEIIRIVNETIWYPEVLNRDRDLIHCIQIFDECELDITEEYKTLTEYEREYLEREFTVKKYGETVLCYDTRTLFFYWVIPDFYNTEEDEIK